MGQFVPIFNGMNDYLKYVVAANYYMDDAEDLTRINFIAVCNLLDEESMKSVPNFNTKNGKASKTCRRA